MSPEFGESLYAEINEKADKKKARVAYEIDLIEQNEDFYRSILIPGWATDQDPDLALYNAVTGKLNHVEDEALRIGGAFIYHRTPTQVENTQDPLIRLGWMEYSEPMLRTGEPFDPTKTYAYVKLPTELGIQLVDGRRAIEGRPPVMERLEILRKRYNEPLSRRAADVR